MSTIEKIKAEIERLKGICLSQTKANPGQTFPFIMEMTGYDKLLSFLDTLESETTSDTRQCTPRPSVDIEDVARVQFAAHAKVFDKKRIAIFDWEQFKEVAGIFYGFGKKDTLESKKLTQEEWELNSLAYLEQLGYTCIPEGAHMTVNQEGLEEEYKDYVERDPVYSKLVNRNAGLDIARHFAKWGAEHRGSSEVPKEDKLRYCIEYINPRFPLSDNGGLNVRHLRVPDEHWAEMAITLILSFGGKIYALYRGNVKDGKLADWPTPMIVESEDWVTDEWLHELMDCGQNCL